MALLNIRNIAKNSAGPTQPATTLQGQNWKEKLYATGEANRKFMSLVDISTDLVGSKDKTLTLAKQSAHLAITQTPPDQTGTTVAVRTLTRMDTVLTNVDVTFAAGDYSYGQIGITEHDVETSRVDKFKIARALMAQEIANCPDKLIATALQSTNVTNVVWGGGKTNVGGLVDGDTMTVDLLSDAATLIEDKDFVPYAVVLHPFQTSKLKKSAQFTSANLLGSDRVNLTGMIGEFAGIKVIQSTNAPYMAAGGTDVNENAAVGTNMHVGIMVGVGSSSLMGEGGTPDQKEELDKVAGAWIWKKKPLVRYEHDMPSAMHNFYLDMAGKATAIQTDAISLIKTSKV